MNLILLFKSDFLPDSNYVSVNGRRFEHIKNILKAKAGDRLCVGLCNGKMGKGTVKEIDDQSVIMGVSLSRNAPKPLKVKLILALPRPIMCKRILSTAASMGVKEIYLFHSRRVEKSFWKSPALSQEKINECLTLGLEQAKDTLMPKVELRHRFKPFIEDEIPGIAEGTVKFIAHPESKDPCPAMKAKPITLVIGPEGGFIPYEIEKFKEIGFKPVALGRRILRVEPAVTAFLSKFLN